MKEFSKKFFIYILTLILLVGTFTCVTTASVRKADDFDGDVVYNPWGLPDDNNKPGDITIDDPGVVAITIKKKDLKISIKSATKKKKSKTAKIVLSNSKVKKIIRKNVKYQIRYSIKKSMKKCKTKTYKTTKIKLKKMKAGKKYYIKARAFVKGFNGKKIYGAWTKAKRIKLK